MGFLIVKEGDFWGLYFDRDNDRLKGKVTEGTPVLEVELMRKEVRGRCSLKEEAEAELPQDLQADVTSENAVVNTEPCNYSASDEKKLAESFGRAIRFGGSNCRRLRLGIEVALTNAERK